MTIHHHIPDDVLIAYGAGNLTEAWSLLVATHLALCPCCRETVNEAELMGGVLLDTVAPAVLAEGAFDQLMSAVEVEADADEEPAAPTKPVGRVPSVLPEPLRSYVGGDLHRLKWRRLGRGAFHVPIGTANGQATARLLKVPAGQAVPLHGHQGEELTLVLTGSFQTHQGEFHRGDVEVADGEVEHMPVVGADEECICLAVTDAPLRFKTLSARLIQPFIGI